MKVYEIIIVGAGPAGLGMAVEASVAGISPEDILILEKDSQHSASIRKFYPENKLVTANYKGIDAECTGTLCLQDTSKQATLEYLSDVIENYQLKVLYNQSVFTIDKRSDELFNVITDHDTFVAKTTVVAIGTLGRPNKPDYKIPSSIRSLVSYDITTKTISDKDVLVVGGGDSASEYVQHLVDSNKSVTISYRRESFTKMNDLNLGKLQDLKKNGSAKILLNSDIESLEENEGKVLVKYKDSMETTYDHIVYALGGSSPKDFLARIGIELTKEGIKLNATHESDVNGLFLIGDIAAGRKGGSINLAFNSANQAIKAICENYLECSL